MKWSEYNNQACSEMIIIFSQMIITHTLFIFSDNEV